jgi:hypothetical protein
MVTAKGWQENGVLPPALRALLLRSPPNFRNLDPGNEVLPPNADPVEVLTDRVLHLDHSVLAIQGPPGTGKTYTAAQIIVGLMRANKRVGVASNNHAAIDKLLVDAVRAARALDVPLRAIRFGREAPEGGVESLRRAADFDPSTPGPLLLAGTAWVFSQATLRDTLDVLIVDEAGQVSLANMVGMAPSAQSLVLVGDQMQLDQPTQAAHPGDSGQSAIQFLLKGHATVPPTLGAFLSETRRLHPELCRFVSDAIYEGRLSARPENGRRVVIARAPEGALVRPSGLVFVPVKHHGNTRESAEEVGEVVRIVDDLLGCERTNQHGERLGPVRPEDILVVAPYNAQVRRLQAALPHVRVGTVDRFQGQEAQVVIISMTTSGDEPPSRGIEFLFSPNRLNVAVSRAQSLAFIVADPRHTRASVANLQAMTRINLFGRLIGARPLRQEEAGL